MICILNSLLLISEIYIFYLVICHVLIQILVLFLLVQHHHILGAFFNSDECWFSEEMCVGIFASRFKETKEKSTDLRKRGENRLGGRFCSMAGSRLHLYDGGESSVTRLMCSAKRHNKIRAKHRSGIGRTGGCGGEKGRLRYKSRK